MPNSNNNRNLLVLLVLGVIGAIILGAYFKMSTPPDQYVQQAPPPGPNAKPDPPNPDKVNHMPGAASMAGGGGHNRK